VAEVSIHVNISISEFYGIFSRFSRDTIPGGPVPSALASKRDSWMTEPRICRRRRVLRSLQN
jgi:hypothetical protein